MDWVTCDVSIDTLTLQVEGQAWFGGGADLTPAYLCEADAKKFHHFWHELCKRHKVCNSNCHNEQVVQMRYGISHILQRRVGYKHLAGQLEV